jgi:hypothetical protein
LILGSYENQVLHISHPDPQHTSTSNGRLSYHLIITDDSFFIATALENGMPKHTKNPVKGRETIHKGWHAPALHDITTFSGYSTFHRPRCYKSEGGPFASSLPRKHIYPLHHHSRTQTRGRSNTASLATLSIIFFLFLHFLINTFSGHISFCTYPCRGHGSHNIGRKQAGREAWCFHTNLTFAYFGKDAFGVENPCPWCLSEYWR